MDPIDKDIMMNKIRQNEIPLNLSEDESSKPTTSWKLVRERDGLIMESSRIKWIGWDHENMYTGDFSKPNIGLSLLMSPFTMEFTWHTTRITEILEESSGYVKFKTMNSTYELRTC